MPLDPHAHFDQAVLDLIEHSPVGRVPRTPSYDDALVRLTASHQVYASADHKDAHVTARSLASRASFWAANLADFLAGGIDAGALEANASIFGRYVGSLPAEARARAEGFRVAVIGKPAQHRAKHGAAAAHDPLHTLFLLPGAGPHPGLPGNYLHGSVFHVGGEGPAGSWLVSLHDSDDGEAHFNRETLGAALAQMQELIAMAPFHLSELAALGATTTASA
jgi:hypothetical protein